MSNVLELLPYNRIRVLVVDDYPIMRNGLKFFLLAYEDLELVGEAVNGKQAVTMCRQLQPDVVLLGHLMPTNSGLRIMRLIHRACPHTQIIALATTISEGLLTEQVLAAGASCRLTKSVSAQELAETIRAVSAHHVALPVDNN